MHKALLGKIIYVKELFSFDNFPSFERIYYETL